MSSSYLPAGWIVEPLCRAATCLRIDALVHVRAVATGLVQLVALVTDTAEHAIDVLAAAEHAEIVEHAALVDIYGEYHHV